MTKPTGPVPRRPVTPQKRVEDLLARAESSVREAVATLDQWEDTPVPPDLSERISAIRQEATQAGMRFRNFRNKVVTVSALADELRATRKAIKSHRFVAFRNYQAMIALLVALSRKAEAHISTVEMPPNPEEKSKEADRYLLIEIPTGQVSFGITRSLLTDLKRLGVPSTGQWDGHSTDEKTERIFGFLRSSLTT